MGKHATKEVAAARYCGACGTQLPPQQGRGRARRYCDDACQQDAWRRRDGEKRNAQVLRNSPLLDLIFCAGDNERFFQIAHQAGFLLGIRSGRSSHGYPMQFIDIKYRQPNFERHLAVVKKHRPKYAIVPDLSDETVSREDIARALRQYQQLAGYCAIPLIVPKLSGQLVLLPDHVAIGYSVESPYGAARYDLWELEGRRIHLLGGSPHKQMDIYQSLSHVAQIMSADGNMAMHMARNFSRFWQDGQWVYHPMRGKTTDPLYLDCWQRSCTNMRRAWLRFVAVASMPPKAPGEARVAACLR